MRLSLIALSALVLVASAPPQPVYDKSGAIAGPEGQGWDFAAFDPATDQVFVAHGGAVTVIDRAHGDAVRSIGEISHGHAVVPLPHGRLAVTSGGDDTVRIIDVAGGTQLASIPVGKDPDAALLDPATGHLLTMDAHGGTVSEVDLAAHKVVRSVTLKPGLEYPVIWGRTLYVNNEDENEVETVDLASGKVGKPIALTGCEGPTGLALDAAHGRLISACANNVALVVDLKSKAVAQTLAIGKGPDFVLLDSRRHLALIPCGGSATLEAFSLSGTKVAKLASIPTERGARTGAIDERTGTVFLPTARFDPPEKPGDRPKAQAGSFHVLILTRHA